MYTNKQILNVSYPIFLSLLAQTIIGVTDTAFLGRVGEVELGASSMGSLFYICVFTIAFGFSTGSQIIIARRNGEENYKNVGPVMIQGTFFLLGMAVLAFGLSRFWAPDIMRLLISSDKIFNTTMSFLNWRIYGFFFAFVNVMFRALYIGIARTRVLTISAAVMASVNVILAYTLIFGHFGFPRMGIEGAAIASVIAEISSVLFLIVYTHITVDFKKYGFTQFRYFDVHLIIRVLSISSFTMMQYFLSMATWFVFFVAVERLGQRELAVANVVRSIYVVMLIPVNALSTTTNTLVSNAIGAGGVSSVMQIMKKIAKLSFLIVFSIVALVVVFPKAILSVYTNEVALIEEAVNSVYVISIAMLVASVSNVYFNGISGTGNTRSALMLEIITLIFYTGYIFLVAVYFKAPVEICFGIEILYYVLLLIASFIYLKKANWQSKKL
ncbi:MATE family efflux transporter [uncultured Bacteroides sp.]|uniref:MATE family efflux transporter n=1 Tax=uncultured Bacteroides sp. TaxID=162156 RepID=UPI002AA6B8B7|nr:MATE family efflux transporter [uncultured Bacteroides sp.]